MTRRTNLISGFLLMCLFIFNACSKFDAIKSSLVVNNTLDSSSTVSAAFSVTVFNDDSIASPIINKGLCWGTAPNPTFDSSQHEISPNKAGTFKFLINGLLPATVYYFRGYASNRNGTVYGKQISFRTPAISPYSLGQFYAGGLIFYIDSTGNHGLVADTTDIGDSITRHIGSNDTLVASGTAIGTGASNTAKIVAHYYKDSASAAWKCKNYIGGGYTDWFLPSKDELNLMRQNLYAKGLGTWSAATYWSSSEYVDVQGRYYAWAQYFTNGYQYYFRQYFPLNVRAVRAF